MSNKQHATDYDADLLSSTGQQASWQDGDNQLQENQMDLPFDLDLARTICDEPMIDLNEPPPPDDDSTMSRTPRVSDSETFDDNDITTATSQDSKPCGFKRMKVADSGMLPEDEENVCIEESSTVFRSSGAVYFGHSNNEGKSRWSFHIKRFSEDYLNYPSWSDHVCEQVKARLRREGFVDFYVSKTWKDSKTFQGKKPCSIWTKATTEEILAKTKQRFRDDRKAAKIAQTTRSMCNNTKGSSKGMFRLSNPSSLESEQGGLGTISQTMRGPENNNVARVPSLPYPQMQQDFRSLHERTHNIAPSNDFRPPHERKELKPTHNITPNNVCFDWATHPGTVRWLEVTKLFSENTQEFPEWSDDIANHVKDLLDQEDIILFLVLLDAKGEPTTSILDGTWYRATSKVVLEKTKDQFNRDRKPKSKAVFVRHVSAEWPPSHGGSNGNSSSWDDSHHGGYSWEFESSDPTSGPSQQGSSGGFSSFTSFGNQCNGSVTVDAQSQVQFLELRTNANSIEAVNFLEQDFANRNKNSPNKENFEIEQELVAEAGPCNAEFTDESPQNKFALLVGCHYQKPEFDHGRGTSVVCKRQQWFKITPKDVCFEWTNHPGTVRWRKLVEDFSHEYSEWDDAIADLIRKQIENQDVLFLTLDSEATWATHNFMGCCTDPLSIVENTKKQFFQYRHLVEGNINGYGDSGASSPALDETSSDSSSESDQDTSDWHFELCTSDAYFNGEGVVSNKTITDFSTAVCYGFVSHPPTTLWHSIIKKFSNDYKNYHFWTEDIHKKVRMRLLKHGITCFLLCRDVSNIKVCTEWHVATDEEVMERTKYHFVIDRVSHTVLNVATSAKKQPNSSTRSTSSVLVDDSDNVLVSRVPPVPSNDHRSLETKQSDDQPNVMSTNLNSIFTRQIWYEIAPNDVCFERRSHPGTTYWYDMIAFLAAANDRDYPEWDDKIVALVVDKKDVLFLHATTNDKIGYMATPAEILQKSRDLFLQQRGQFGKVPRISDLVPTEQRLDNVGSCPTKDETRVAHHKAPPSDHISLLTHTLAKLHVETARQADAAPVVATQLSSPVVIQTDQQHPGVETLSFDKNLRGSSCWKSSNAWLFHPCEIADSSWTLQDPPGQISTSDTPLHVAS